MSSRGKRKLESFDPNASDPDDIDFEDAPAPQRRRNRNKRPTPGSKARRGHKRPRRDYGGSDVDDDDEIVSDDEFTERESSEEPPINPSTGRTVRRTAQKKIKYEEPSEEEDAIENTPSVSEEDAVDTPPPRSLIVKLKMHKGWPAPPTRSMRNRTGNKTAATRGRTPEVASAGITRRSSRLSHDVEAPIVALSDSGRHVNIVRQGTRSPEPVIARATRGGKGPRAEHPSAIMEASQEVSMVRDEEESNSPGPLDEMLTGDEPHVEVSVEASPGPEAQGPDDANDDADADADADADDDGMGDHVIQESQHDAAAEESEEEEGPITRGGRNLRSRGKSAKRKRGADESSDFEPIADDDKEEEEMSASDRPKGRGQTSEGSSSGGRRSTRIQAKTRKSTRSRRNSDSSEEESPDPDEIAEEMAELNPNKRRRLSRKNPDDELSYDRQPKLRNRARNPVDYRIMRPEQNEVFDDEEAAFAAQPNNSRSRGGRAPYRSLFSNQGPFGGGFDGGLTGTGAVGGIDSDSSDEEVQRAPRGLGGAVGMTPTTATAPNFGFPQTHNADPQQAANAGGGPANFGKVKDKKALADADPLGVDVNVNFDGVGGLDDHIGKLKEMIMLPLLYPEVFQRFKTTPPRGVLFHGPPGTGKTLLARALASSVSAQGQKVTFYMRKGADALSKWVGEAERQLRLLFEEARKTQPSIIFFDEIDGLAPVRSSKQEQIHASIVATLLALMDGMDGRGQVVVIGATNRPDSVDPALRRPGRFDREFYFPLPSLEGRRSIIDIHTKNWEPPLQPEMKDQLAEITKGYGGADLRALCTEAALNAVQGTYPQIYQSERKLLIDINTIKVLPKDFMISVNKIVPSSQRTASSPAAPLAKHIEPLLRKPLADVLKIIDELIPRRKKLTALEEAEYDDRDDEKGFEKDATLRHFMSGRIFRPRLLITGLQGMGQQYLGAALLSKIEGLHVQSFDLPTILEDPTRTPEAAISQLFTEVRRHKPSVIYIPHVDIWYQTLPAPAIKMFNLLLRSISTTEPILLLGIVERADEKDRLDPQMMKDLFQLSKHNQYELQRPDQPARTEFFNSISHYIQMSPADFPDPDNRKKRILPELEPAPLPGPVVDPQEVAAREKKQRKQDRLTLNKLKVTVQPIMDQLKKSYRKFFKPVIDENSYRYLLDEEDPNHLATDLAPEQQQELGFSRPYERGKDSKGIDVLVETYSGKRYYNLDLGNIEKRLSNGYYKRAKDFLADIKTLAKDARTAGDAERTLKANEMLANVEVDIEMITQTNPALAAECEAVYLRELERDRKAEEKRQKAIAEGMETAEATAVPPQQSGTTVETSGAIHLGEPIPGRSTAAIPPVTPLRAFPPAGPLSNGTSADETSHAAQNGSTVPSGLDEDAHMTDSQDISVNTQQDFQTPSGVGTQTQPYTQTQKSQVSGRTFMAPNSHPGDYHNSASTTTSGHKTSDRSSGGRFNTQSTNGVNPVGVPDFSQMMPEGPPGASQLPDTQEVHYVSSQLSNSQQSQAQNSMPAPAPRHSTNIASLLNNEDDRPTVILDNDQLQRLHEMLVTNTSGCSVEQLEQVNAALMETIWRYRGEYNRNVLIHHVQDAFNAIIDDIQDMQRILRASQETPEPSQPHRYGFQGTQFPETQLPSQEPWGIQSQTHRGVPEASQFP